MGIEGFFQQYFISPLVHPHTEVYNLYNTPVYGLVFAIAVFAVYKLMKKMEVPIDRSFFLATLPYIFLASILRVLRDADILTSPVYVSPLLYLTIFAVTITALTASLALQKFFKVQYFIPMLAIGAILIVGFALKLKIVHPAVFLQVFGLTALAGALLFGLYKFQPRLFTPINCFVLLAAMFDASSTFVGVSFFGAIEKHVLPSFLITHLGGAWIMFPLKFFVILLALWAIDNTETDTFLANFLKFAILTITVGPGMRNTLRLAMGV